MNFSLRRAVMIVCLFAVSVSAQPWTQFRGRNASGIAEGGAVPVTWNLEKKVNIAWKAEIPGLAHSSPIVWDDKVFVTTAVSSDPKSVFRSGLFGDVDSAADLSRHSWRVYCLDRKSGKVLWQRVAYEGVPRTKRHIKASFANSTPATDGRNVVAFFGSEGLFCYDTKGKLKWKVDVGTLDSGWFFDPDYQWGTASSPIIYKNMVILQCDIQAGSFIAAYDLKNGKEIWKTERAEIPSWGTPTIYEGKSRTELITNATKFIRGYNPLTGAELWRMSGNPEITATTPIARDEIIYICNGYRPNRPIYAIRAGANGDISLKEGQETNESVVWSKQRGGTYMPTPLLYGEFLYTLENQGVLTAWNAMTGERVWQHRLADKGGSFSASPVINNGNIYLASEDGEVHVVRAGSKYELLATNLIGEVIMATPAISDKMIFIRGQHHLFAIAEKTGLKETVSQ